MNDNPAQLMRDYPELLRMATIYFFGLIGIAWVGWSRVLTRAREGTLRQSTWVAFPLPFSLGIGFFLILLSVLFLMKGFGAMLVAVVSYFFLMHQSGRGILKALGMERYRGVTIACAAVGLAAITFGPAYLFSWINAMICHLLNWEASAQPLVYEFVKMKETKSILIFIGVATIAAPLTEEILFRGLLYPVLRDEFGMKVAVIVSAIGFGLAHMHAPTFLPLTFLGVILALSYEFSGSLLLSMLIHATFNLFTVLNLLLLKPYLLK